MAQERERGETVGGKRTKGDDVGVGRVEDARIGLRGMKVWRGIVDGMQI